MFPPAALYPCRAMLTSAITSPKAGSNGLAPAHTGAFYCRNQYSVHFWAYISRGRVQPGKNPPLPRTPLGVLAPNDFQAVCDCLLAETESGANLEERKASGAGV